MRENDNRKEPPIDRVHHVESDVHPVDEAIDRRSPQRALRARIAAATRKLEAALGPRRGLWLSLEEPLNELRSNREDAYFNLGYEHGFAEGRRDARRTRLKVRELTVRLRDYAIQHGVRREDALSALLEAALALAFGSALAKATAPKK